MSTLAFGTFSDITGNLTHSTHDVTTIQRLYSPLRKLAVVYFGEYRQFDLPKGSVPESGPGSAFRILTWYGLDGPGIESRWGARYFAPVQTGPGTHPASFKMGMGYLPGVKLPGRDVDHLPHSNVEFKERVELYLYSPSGPSWLVIG
jgi:hypothetical protein